MKAFFPQMIPAQVKSAIEGALAGRKMAELMRLTLGASTLEATITKLGTSTLTFTTLPKDGGTEVTLTTEKLALAHRPLRGEVKEKFMRLVEKAGGTVTQRG